MNRQKFDNYLEMMLIVLDYLVFSYVIIIKVGYIDYLNFIIYLWKKQVYPFNI